MRLSVARMWCSRKEAEMSSLKMNDYTKAFSQHPAFKTLLSEQGLWKFKINNNDNKIKN